MVDIFLYPGEPEPEDIRLSDPTQARAGGVTVTPAAVSCRAMTADPDLVLGSIEVSPALAEAGALAINPTVFVSEPSIPVGGGHVGLVRQVRQVRPVRHLLKPAPAPARAESIGPEIILGSIVFAPAPAMARARGLVLGIELGDLAIIPGAARAVAAGMAPEIAITGESWDDALMDELLAILA